MEQPVRWIEKQNKEKIHYMLKRLNKNTTIFVITLRLNKVKNFLQVFKVNKVRAVKTLIRYED